LIRHWRGLLIAVLAGLLAGVWLGSRLERAAAHRMRRQGPRPERVVKMLRRELDLRPDQVQALRALLTAKKASFQAIRREEESRMAALRTEIDRDLAPFLDDTQKKKLEALRARWQKPTAEPGPPDAR
jgi:glucose-6-phosphate dehydrogenase assembly protein OpcA